PFWSIARAPHRARSFPSTVSEANEDQHEGHSPRATTSNPMSSTDVAISTPNQPQTLNRKTGKPLKVTGKLSEVLDLMVEEGMKYPDACIKAGLATRSARAAFDKPHVLNELRRRKQVFRASISAANISRLAEIRDQDDNRMAALGAI